MLLITVLCGAQLAVAGTFWYENIVHNGISPTIPNGHNWTVFRNVKDFGAKGDGTADDTAAIQAAISTGDSTGLRDSPQFGSTGQPAMVYFPSGTYLIKSTIRSAVGTVLMGDPTDRPTIKAASNFTGQYLVIGRGQRFAGLVGFYYGVKNLALDSTAVPTRSVTLLEWSVSQNNILSNVKFNMTPGAAGHVGIAMPQICSSLIMNDLEFYGGGIGVLVTSTQYHLKDLFFDGVQTAVRLARMIQGTGQGLRFNNCKVGIDATGGGAGMFSLIDSTAANTTTVVLADHVSADDTSSGSLVLQNIIVDSTVAATLQTANETILTGSILPNTTYTRGSIYNPNFTRTTGISLNTTRPSALTNPSGIYHTVKPPTYADTALSSVINVKTHPLYPVFGDGKTDDTVSLQAIITSSPDKLLYFPHGIYILTSTLHIPPSARLIGEAWTQISARGSYFADPLNPKPLLRVGNPGDIGVAQLSDFILTVADILPGAVLVEVNMKGRKPGDVGFFNTHFRVGGARGSTLHRKCRTPDGCLAARLMVHLRETSSSYWENSWGWTADHDLDPEGPGEVGLGDGEGETYPATGGGWLIESREGTWVLGSGPEHNVLYQMNIHNARNVFIGLQQGETAYWQGKGNTLLAPEPWGEYLLPSDPDFGWCAPDDATCRMGLYQRISNSTDISIYSSGFWNFVAGPKREMCTSDCQDNAVLYEKNSRLFVYGLSTINNKNLVIERTGGEDTATVAASRAENTGAGHDGFSNAIVAAYLRQSGAVGSELDGGNDNPAQDQPAPDPEIPTLLTDEGMRPTSQPDQDEPRAVAGSDERQISPLSVCPATEPDPVSRVPTPAVEPDIEAQLLPPLRGRGRPENSQAGAASNTKGLEEQRREQEAKELTTRLNQLRQAYREDRWFIFKIPPFAKGNWKRLDSFQAQIDQALLEITLDNLRPQSATTYSDNLMAPRGNIWILDGAQLLCAWDLGLISSLPDVSEADISDKSKGDWITKLFAVIQVLWMWAQIVKRETDHLTVAQLEVMTAAFAACSAITYIMYLFKPKDVGTRFHIKAAKNPTIKDMMEMARCGPSSIYF
ncbi:hypothetical protein OQA88_2549 [Cercophora sp. LCS_1]